MFKLIYFYLFWLQLNIQQFLKMFVEWYICSILLVRSSHFLFWWWIHVLHPRREWLLIEIVVSESFLCPQSLVTVIQDKLTDQVDGCLACLWYYLLIGNTLSVRKCYLAVVRKAGNPRPALLRISLY